MSVNSARKWLIVGSLLITGVQLIFFLTAPAIGFPLDYPKNFDLLQITLPVFLGYLGSATNFIFQSSDSKLTAENELLSYLIIGPILIYVFATIGALAAFGYTNRSGAVPGSGMSVESLATSLSLALGVLAATTGVLVSYLFAASNQTSARAGTEAQ